jgi:UDP-3-O-[3-hydroxymyristoyl] glucosamine N-acyltransferase
MKLAELADFLTSNGFPSQVDGQSDLDVTAVNTLENARSGEISFLANPKYRSLLPETQATAVIVKPHEDAPDGLTTVRTDEPYAAITATIIKLHGYRVHPQWGLDDHATVSPSATLGDNPNIGPHVTIADQVVIGKNVTIYPGCYVGDGVSMGDDVILFPNVVVYNGVTIGHRVTIHACSSIGQDGLGYAPINNQWLKIPQVGDVVIEDDVEMGAACTIDRATLGTTRIEQGTKFSNAVVVGHGTSIGKHCMFVAQVATAGSARIGNHVTLAGQVGVGGHLTVGDHARVGAQSGVMKSLPGGKEYLGSPAIDSMTFRRQLGHVARLSDVRRKVQDLQTQIDQLKQAMDDDDNNRPR